MISPRLNINYILKESKASSLRSLALLLDVHYNTVGNWNKGTSQPKLKDIINISKLLDERNIDKFILYPKGCNKSLIG